MNNKTLKVGEILQILIDNLQWDGRGYWFPDICIKKTYKLGSCQEPPTKTEMHDFLKKLQNK